MATQIQQIYKLIVDGDFEKGAGTVKELDAVTPYVDEVAASVPLRTQGEGGT